MTRPIFSREQRDAWYANTKESPFNRWLDAQVKDRWGQLDLERLREVGRRWGVSRNYAHLNPGQERMCIGNLLRKRVPESEYAKAPPRLTASLVGPTGSGAVGAAVGRAPQPAAPPVPAPPAVGVAVPGPPSLERRLIRASSVRELLAMHGAIMDELRERKVVRTGNAPGGDYAELLFARAFGWTLETSSAAGHDATNAVGERFQIKSRRLSRPTSSRQLSSLRRLPEKTFDFLAAILFSNGYEVLRAVIAPHAMVEARAKFIAHTNAWAFHLDDAVWALPGVRDVTLELRQAADALDI